MTTDLYQIMQQLCPTLQAGVDYTLICNTRTGQVIGKWNSKTVMQPTSEQIATARAAISFKTVQAAKLRSLNSELKTTLIVQFQSWTPVQRAVMNGAMLAIYDMLANGAVADAISAIEGYPLPDPSYTALRAALLADLNAYAPKLSAVAGASTIEAVNAV